MAVALKPLAEQVIVITGASSGIGLATAYRAAEAGARVVLSSRNGDTLAKIVREIRNKGGEAIHVVADVTKRKELERVAAAAVKEFGGFDTWVNDAGLGIFGRLTEVSEEDHRRLFDVNFWGVVYGTQIAAEHLTKKGGAIINLGSIASEAGLPLQGMYSASKHAIAGFTDAFRMEMEEAGAPISITLIRPTSIDTPFPVHAKNYTQGRPTLPPPVYTPEDVADAILYAAVHGGRDYYIGGGAKLISVLNRFVPAAVDWMGAHVLSKQSVKDSKSDPEPEGTLETAGGDGQARGGSDRISRRSVYTRARLHPFITGTLAAGAGITAAAFFTLRGR